MKKLFGVVAVVCLSLCGFAQNWTTVSASNITDLNQQKLAAGSLCFLGTDQNDIPISFEVGGGGQVLARPFCVTVTNGSSAALTVPNPQNTQPQGIYYRVTVTDSSTGQVVLRYVDESGNPTGYPGNPSGAQAGVAGICDATGRVLGLMPHPERHVLPTQHPQWTRLGLAPAGDGLRLFRNAVECFQ